MSNNKRVVTSGILGRGQFGYIVTPGGQGGCWQLDTRRRLDTLLGREVTVEGMRCDFNWLSVDSIEPLVQLESGGRSAANAGFPLSRE
jgi:hypothetical protein